LLAKGLVFLSGESPESAPAQECLEQAMVLAGQQSARAFELRAGLELARLWIGQGQVRRAHHLIALVYSRFTEGFATPDLIRARRMLEQTSAPARGAA
jgi:predicted ATPase